MSSHYQAVNWNRQKFRYDGIAIAAVILSVAGFAGGTLALHRDATAETALIRGLGFSALLLLHFILCIGPLSRLDSRFLPVLYNRRHLGVLMFLLALAHAGFSLIQFHALGDVNPFISLLTGNREYSPLSEFPFELLGLAALLILFLMAATSHDYWLANLTARNWKALHMMVYVAYGLVVAHVALGLLQAERSPVLTGLLGIGIVVVVGLHLIAGFRERPRDAEIAPVRDGWLDVCAVSDLIEGKGRVAVAGSERIALFRYEGKVSCVSNVCRHQNGPLGEGRIVNGCITCPWHGYQYLPDSGTSPPPFTEKIPTYQVRVVDGRVLVDPRPNPPGTRVEPARTDRADKADKADEADEADEDFYVGYHPQAPTQLGRFLRRVSVVSVVGGASLALLLAAAQRPFAAARFEFGVERQVSGWLSAKPYPMLLVLRPGGRDSASAYSRYLLAGSGKHGAGPTVDQYDGQWVTLSGSLVYRDNQTMLEVIHASATRSTAPSAMSALTAPPVSLGRFSLTGEIVDSKCWLGVMNPGELKTHKTCAIRCLSGGLPPLFVVRDSLGAIAEFLLISPAGGPVNREVLGMVAEPVRIAGEVERWGDLLLLAADPSTYQKLR